jgi:hypothetical protein
MAGDGGCRNGLPRACYLLAIVSPGIGHRPWDNHSTLYDGVGGRYWGWSSGGRCRPSRVDERGQAPPSFPGMGVP